MKYRVFKYDFALGILIKMLFIPCDLPEDSFHKVVGIVIVLFYYNRWKTFVQVGKVITSL